MNSQAKCLISALLVLWSFVRPFVVFALPSPGIAAPVEAMQAAEILGVKTQLDRLLALKAAGESSISNVENLALRTLILRRVLLGFLEIRRACNKVDVELTYSYGLLQKEQRKEDGINQFLNWLNFTQFGTSYAIEPLARMQGEFVVSSCLTTASASLGMLIPTLGILYKKTAKAKHLEPPKFIRHIVGAGPVDARDLPPLVQKYMDSCRSGSALTHREEMFALWQRRYAVDASNKESLCSLLDGKAKSLSVLNTRILLLWSLHTFIQDFDHELLALVKVVKSDYGNDGRNADLSQLGLSASAVEAAQLLKITDQVAKLVELKKSGQDSEVLKELELHVQGSVLLAALEVRLAADKIDEEVNYTADVVLNQLKAARSRRMQLNYEATFINNGVFSANAGALFMHGMPAAANEMFVIG
ncbi:MAG: hypothetical protein K2X81_06295, partial [Candidatus Obscuribacterales bacterium]|nr:hypothetical protein [Candidatus Obscuribacterales bacterium]